MTFGFFLSVDAIGMGVNQDSQRPDSLSPNNFY